MGKQSRLKRQRREMRLQENGPPMKREAFHILKAIHQTIQGHCGDNSRRCWEYLLELLAHSTGWVTDTSDAKHLWDKMANETRWSEFFECWMDEVTYAEKNRVAFSEPVGELLEEIEGTNDYLAQYFTPMSVVRVMNEITMPAGSCEAGAGGRPTSRGLDPCCGTGRFMIDALVFNPGLFMHAIELDLWLMRTAMLNVRMLCKWTSLRFTLADMLDPMDKEEPSSGGGIIIGGRSVFMNGDALVVDTNYRPNWLCAGWAWKPHPWQGNLKIEGFLGNHNEWVDAGRPAKELPGKPGDVQFDYSMKDPSESKHDNRSINRGKSPRKELDRASSP